MPIVCPSILSMPRAWWLCLNRAVCHSFRRRIPTKHPSNRSRRSQYHSWVSGFLTVSTFNYVRLLHLISVLITNLLKHFNNCSGSLRNINILFIEIYEKTSLGPKSSGIRRQTKLVGININGAIYQLLWK